VDQLERIASYLGTHYGLAGEQAVRAIAEGKPKSRLVAVK
jgi:hypothetical protein